MELEKIIKRLETFGYNYESKADEYSMEFIKQKVINHILNETNQVDVPERLYIVAIDMICVEFLRLKKGTGKLVDSDIEFERAISSISMGDTNISFVNDGTDEQKFDNLLNYVYSQSENELYKFRKLVW